MSYQTPLKRLVKGRMSVLKLSMADLARRLGYKNIDKGIRRIEKLLAGDTNQTTMILTNLPDALDVSSKQIDEAVKNTRDDATKVEEKKYRDSFRPHAVVVTEHSRPSQIFVVAFTGVNRFLRIDFDEATKPKCFSCEALTKLPIKSPFGKSLGFIVNYTPDHAVEYNLLGHPISISDRAIRIAEAKVYVNGRKVNSAFEVNL